MLIATGSHLRGFATGGHSQSLTATRNRRRPLAAGGGDSQPAAHQSAWGPEGL